MNDFGRLLEKEIPRLRRYARALGKTCSMKARAPSACGPGLAPRRQAVPAAAQAKTPELGSFAAAPTPRGAGPTS
jgi:hypothetical protein